MTTLGRTATIDESIDRLNNLWPREITRQRHEWRRVLQAHPPENVGKAIDWAITNAGRWPPTIGDVIAVTKSHATQANAAVVEPATVEHGTLWTAVCIADLHRAGGTFPAPLGPALTECVQLATDSGITRRDIDNSNGRHDGTITSEATDLETRIAEHLATHHPATTKPPSPLIAIQALQTLAGIARQKAGDRTQNEGA